MQSRNNLLLARLLGTLVGLGFLVQVPSPVRGAERQVLRSALPAAARQAPALERLAGNQRLNLAIGLPLRDAEGLTNLLREIYDPASPSYRRYLTPGEFARRFGPTEADYAALIDFAKASGFEIVGTHPNRTLLDVEASVADIERALKITLRVYRHPTESRNFFAPDTEPSLDIKVPVLGIDGLDDFSPPRPLGRVAFAEDLSNTISYATGSGPRGNFFGRDYRAAYAPDLLLDGAGESVGIFTLDGYFSADVAAYLRLAGLPEVPLTNVLVGGVSGKPGSQNIETVLDIQMVISMAPGLDRVIIYQGRSTTPNDVLNRMATDNLARQLSSSWGVGTWSVDPVREQILQQFAAQGQSFFQASGDTGTWNNGVYPPSDEPLATVVGGTELTTHNDDGVWQTETTWSLGGGGVSTNFAIPSWQQGFDMSVSQGSTARRNLPDVACVADSIWIVANNGELGATGGTSAAAPLWAGFAALVNQQAASNGQPPIGFANPALYAIGKGPGRDAAFHDIITGNNTNSGSANKYFAVPGYDLCTGWGTPAGSNLISALLDAPASLGIRPETVLAFSGPVGGPFAPAAGNWLLTNQTALAFDWALGGVVSWLGISSSGGTLVPGGSSANVNVVPNASAAALPVGSYTNTIWFTNLNELSTQSRIVVLDVVAPPMITGQPAGQAVPEGAMVTFAVGVSNPAAATFVWQFDDGTNTTNLSDDFQISGSATPLLTINDVGPGNAGKYSVIVSNAAGAAVSSNALLTVLASKPVITLQPANKTVLPGQSVVLRAAGYGSQPLFCRWVHDWNLLYDGSNISGAGTPELTIRNASAADAGTYFLIFGNSYGLAATSNAVLSVTSVTAPGITLSTLHSFADGSAGSHPNGLLLDSNGALYGTARYGGAHHAGTVFQLGTNNAVMGLYSFTGTNDGATPLAGLAPGPEGNFYGSTFQGGETDNGTLFRITPAGALTTLAQFNITNGDFPFATLTFGSDANFYGTSYQGGANGRGTVFKLSTNGTLTILQNFANGADGGHPAGRLVEGDNGGFFGVTYKGGVYGSGTVFKITTNGSWTLLYSFDGTNSGLPIAGLTRGDDGNFYGATTRGGAYDGGTLFRCTPAGTLTRLYSFTGGSDGANPQAALLFANDGNFYGTTPAGGAYGKGTLFQMTPGGVVTTFAAFEGFNGANPLAALIEGAEGNLFGATLNGGEFGSGTLFRMSLNPAAPQITAQPTGQSVFAGSDVRFSVSVFGSSPFSYRWRKDGTNLTDGSGVFGVGTRVLTLSNVSLSGAGVYSVLITNSFGSIVSAGAQLSVTSSPPYFVLQPTNQTLAPGANAVFGALVLGNQPLSYEWRRDGSPLSDAGNVVGSTSPTLAIDTVTEANNGTYTLFASNALGSATSTGAVLTVVVPSASGTRFATVAWFGGTGAAGRTPNELAVGTNGNLYGTTQGGGASVNGTAFELTTNGVLTTLASFNGTNGSQPHAALTLAADGNFYGTSFYGGAYSVGNVFKMSPAGVIQNVYSFTGEIDGGYPYVALVQDADGSLVGASENFYQVNGGIVFRLSPEGQLTNFYSFGGGLDGDAPVGALLPMADGSFNGMTSTGGVRTNGSVFQLSADGAVATTYSFTGGTDGYDPVGALVLGADGSFYGVTRHNRIVGLEFYGTIFKLTPGGQLTTLYALNNTDGAYPYAGLVAGSDGNFYGTTYTGANKPNGSVFRISPAGAFTTLVTLDGFNTGAHPAAALVETRDGALYGTTTTGGPGGWGTIFRVNFTSAPSITMQPVNQTMLVGENSLMQVAVAGAPRMFFQWRKDGTNLIDGGHVSGATNRVLSFTNVTLADSGTYSVVVSNALGSVTSSGAALSVVTKPVIQSVQRAANTVQLSWSTLPGKRYRLQFKTSLTSLAWLNSGAILTATTNTLATTDPSATNAQRFYRVVLLP